jgi:hypothetical protein
MKKERDINECMIERLEKIRHHQAHFLQHLFALKSSNVDLLSSFSSLSSSIFLFHVVSFLLSQSFSTIFHQNWELIEQFYFFLKNLTRKTCDVCNEIEFEMQLQSWNSVMKCYRCRLDRIRNSNSISLFEKENVMNSLSVLSHFFSLSITKKLLIARVHVLMNLRRVRECQYKYSKHVINFMQNSAKIIHRLSSLSTDLQMLVLKSVSSSTRNNNVSMQFREMFRVRRKSVKIWLEYLIRHHFDYVMIQIDIENFKKFLENDFVWDQLSCIDDSVKEKEKDAFESKKIIENSESKKDAFKSEKFIEDSFESKENLIEIACVSDLIVKMTKLKHLKKHVKTVVTKEREKEIMFFMISLEFVSLNEWNIFLHIERMIFSILFLNEVEIYNTLKQKIVELSEYYHHLLRYRDERFVKHFQFRYWAFNTQLRHQSFTISK